MKITLQSNNRTYTVETEGDDLNISDISDVLRGLLVQCGFHPATVEAAFNAEIFESGSWDLELVNRVRPNDLDMDRDLTTQGP